jgi:hypothetical protein
MTDVSLRQIVLRRLAALERLAGHGDPGSLLPTARSELHRMAHSWRLLLTDHQPGPDGRCPACPPRGLRRRRWPCRVWLLAHRVLFGEPMPKS